MAIVNYEDEFDLPPVDYDINKVPKSIKDRAEGVRDAIFGKQNKEFLAQSVEISGLLSAEAKSSAAEISVKQNSLEQRFLTLQQETTNGDYDSAPEIIDARGGKATLGQRLDETTAQLAQNARKMNKEVISPRKRKPLVTIIDDDGNAAINTKWLPLLQSKQFKLDISVITGLVGTPSYLTWEQLEDLKVNYDVELLNHATRHVLHADLNEDELRHEFETSSKILNDKGHHGDIYVWPAGSQDLLARQIARNYFRAAFLDKGGLNVPPLHTFNIRRSLMMDNSSMANMEDLKANVDQAINDNAWVVFMTHSQFGGFDTSKVGELIDYINQKVDNGLIEWVHASEGLDRMGNVIDVGDNEREYSPSTEPFYIVDAEGFTHASREKPVAHLGARVDFNTPLTDYPLNQYSVAFILSSDPTASLFPEGTGGVVETHYEGTGNFSYQRFKPLASNKLYQRAWNVSSKVWGKFERIGEDIVNLGAGDVTNETPPSAFEYGKEYVSTIITANATGLPTGYGGILKTYRYGTGYAYTYQTYKPVYTNKLYVRGAQDSGASWDNWESWSS